VALDRLDAEFAARTPSEAMRAASEQLARGLRRLARAMLPDLAVADPARAPRQHPVLLGALVGAVGGDPTLAARAAALATVTVPASAAVRLLGLDPFAVQAMLADLAREIDHLVLDAAGEPADLPADTAPALDLLADHHLTTEVRLFAS
jgi:urease accessory protein